MNPLKGHLVRVLQYVLKQLARLTIWRYRPGIIGVTGSVGKTSAKLAIATVIASDRSVRFSRGNFNNELGLPLTILGDYEEIKGLFFYPKIVAAAIWNIIVPVQYPEILVLEYAIDHPGDMKNLLSIARPNLGVLTAIGEVPAHVEFFDGPDDVVREKSRLIESLPVASFAILNADDRMVMGLRERTRARVVTFGFSKDADVQAASFANRSDGGRPVGISFKLGYAGTFLPIALDGVFGKTYAYASAAGAAVGLAFGLPLMKVVDALKNYRPAPGRMELIRGLNDTFILNDAYNASPASMKAALETLRSLPGKRKIAVLGDMLEIGTYAMRAHEALGTQAARVLDILVTVGPRAKFIAEGARSNGMRKNMVYSFDTSDEALVAVQGIMRKGDLILVKGSHAMGLEKVVEGIAQSGPRDVTRGKQ